MRLYQSIINTTRKLREKRDLRILSRRVQLTLANGLEVSEMVLVCKSGRMVLAMKASGETIEHTAMGSSSMLTETSMKAIG